MFVSSLLKTCPGVIQSGMTFYVVQHKVFAICCIVPASVLIRNFRWHYIKHVLSP